MSNSNPTRVVTGLARFSYLNVFAPRAFNEHDKPKYSVTLLVPKSDTETVNAVRNAISAAYEDGKAAKFRTSAGKQLTLSEIRTPLRDGDEERPFDPNYAGCYFINCSSFRKPGVVDADLRDILDPSDVVSGDYGRAELSFYAYDFRGNRGIAAGLNNLQLLRKGQPLGGQHTAASAFASVPAAAAFEEAADLPF